VRGIGRRDEVILVQDAACPGHALESRGQRIAQARVEIASLGQESSACIGSLRHDGKPEPSASARDRARRVARAGEGAHVARWSIEPSELCERGVDTVR
jgi:hypothetical protein